MLDGDLKPWLLEVNHSPSFTTGGALDCAVKEALLADTLRLVAPPPPLPSVRTHTQSSAYHGLAAPLQGACYLIPECKLWHHRIQNRL